MNPRTTETEPSDEAQGSATKFTYKSGSTPLDGYTIKRGVGQGGFGEVYYATSDAGKEVALKLIRRNLDVELRGVKHCLNLKHNNLIGLYDIRTDDRGDRWVVMEYVAGESLEEAIERNPNGMPPDQALWWMHGVAAGVAHLHDHGIVHRDLKPGNIFCEDSVVKIGDYGLSKFISCSRRSGQTESIGTVHYMAPEIAGGRYGREIDIYALGIILYEMLTGRVPFEGESIGEVLMKHLTAEPDLAGLEAPYRDIVARALAKDPEVRLGSVGELVAMLPGADVAPAAPHRPAAPVGAQHIVEDVEVVEEEEPILAAVRAGWENLEALWDDLPMHRGVKTLLFVGLVCVMAVSAQLWVVPLCVALFFYAIYRMVRAVAIQPKQSRRSERHAPSSAEPSVQPVADPPKAQPEARRRRHRGARHRGYEELTLPPKSAREKLIELTGSMLLAALMSLVLSIVVWVLFVMEIGVSQFAWLVCAGALSSWAVMIPAKYWEGREGDEATRRLAMLVFGLMAGAAAWGLAEILMVELPHTAHWVQDLGSPLDGKLLDMQGNVLPLGYMAYLGFLFMILRWWRLADPLRTHRLSVWSTGTCIFAAWLLGSFLAFPQPWGLALATIISMSIQLASPWVPPRERKLLAEEV